MPAGPEREDGHAESVLRIQTRMAEAHHLVERNSEVSGEVAEVTLHHLTRERVVTRRDRSVGRKHVRGRDQLKRRVKIEALLDMETNALESEEGGVAFVHVEDF